MSPTRLNVLFVGVVSALTAGFAFGVLMPGLRALGQTREDVAQAAQRTRESQVTAGEETAVYQAIVELQSQLADSRRHVPADRQFGEFLNDISEALRSLGIADYELRPLAEYATQSTGTAAVTGVGRAYVLPVRVQLRCGFKSAFEFLAKVSEMPRLARVAAVDMSARDGRSQRVEVSLLIETFYYPDAAPAGPTAAQEPRA